MAENTAFLALCTLLPLAMIAALAWVAFRKLRDAFAFRHALRTGWERASEAELVERLRGLPALDRSGKVRLSRILARRTKAGSIVTCTYDWSSLGRTNRMGRHEAWLVLTRAGFPRVHIARRGSGALHGLATTLATTLDGSELSLGDAWTALRVSGAGAGDETWFTSARGTALSSLLGPEEALWLHGDSVVLTRPIVGNTHADLLRDAEALAERLSDALA